MSCYTLADALYAAVTSTPVYSGKGYLFISEGRTTSVGEDASV